MVMCLCVCMCIVYTYECLGLIVAEHAAATVFVISPARRFGRRTPN